MSRAARRELGECSTFQVYDVTTDEVVPLTPERLQQLTHIEHVFGEAVGMLRRHGHENVAILLVKVAQKQFPVVVLSKL